MSLYEKFVRWALRYPPHSPARQLTGLCPATKNDLRGCTCKGWKR